ncbi:universal stress protein [Lacticaseibacillus saniviri]|uniref:Universal stress protein UspA-like nucleotide-binding protein n=1 Tax=Lacticaseibacillus saniviri JCM 17471 = DSM 24301 TaxID=1293598 RepID=A0A0R2MVL7_9LACO|nr:universal stress protein [Lacticaseibacillus saniviri]KRO16940.1 universal stress protein UspA-like nucleotide-binding protein [Lacticaseibacillus saniviri JCM 17471 = DSM 24301]MCG4281041.1 universal stress protein [Lacticaseibacillus saniviri]
MATEEEFEVESMHFTRLLLAVDDDDDESSRRAFNYASTLAKIYNIPLGIVSVLETGDLNIYQSLSPDILSARRSEIAAHLNTYVEKAERFGVQDAQPIIGEGKPARVILDEVLPEFKPDLIILGSHKQRGHLHIGSVASEIMRSAEASVIVVR